MRTRDEEELRLKQQNEEWIANLANEALGTGDTHKYAWIAGRHLIFPIASRRARGIHDGRVDLAVIRALPKHEQHVALMHAIRSQMRDHHLIVAND